MNFILFRNKSYELKYNIFIKYKKNRVNLKIKRCKKIKVALEWYILCIFI